MQEFTNNGSDYDANGATAELDYGNEDFVCACGGGAAHAPDCPDGIIIAGLVEEFARNGWNVKPR
jgi:hypothetical protein